MRGSAPGHSHSDTSCKYEASQNTLGFENSLEGLTKSRELLTQPRLTKGLRLTPGLGQVRRVPDAEPALLLQHLRGQHCVPDIEDADSAEDRQPGKLTPASALTWLTSVPGASGERADTLGLTVSTPSHTA